MIDKFICRSVDSLADGIYRAANPKFKPRRKEGYRYTLYYRCTKHLLWEEKWTIPSPQTITVCPCPSCGKMTSAYAYRDWNAPGPKRIG